MAYIIIVLFVLFSFTVFYFRNSRFFSSLLAVFSCWCVALALSLCWLIYYYQLDVSYTWVLLSGLLFVLLGFDRKYIIFRSLSFLAIFFSLFGALSIVICLFFESASFFKAVPITDFLFGTEWRPNEDVKVGSFGVLPLLVGTLLISMVALLISTPIALLSAVYLSEYAEKKVRCVINTALEILSSIPTVVYGYFAVTFLSPVIRRFAEYVGVSASSENALVAGIVIGIMLLPSMTSLMEYALRSVSKILKYGSMALGATCSETVWLIVIPSASPAIINAILLSFSRAIGETMIVLMASGITANLTFNPLHSVTTITVQIATLLTGDQEFNSIETSSAYALGLLLFIFTWFINACALFVIKKHTKPI